MKTFIHVNQHVIRNNIRSAPDERQPVLTCKTYKSNTYANTVALLDADGREVARVIYSPDKPLSCGARVWIETTNDISIIE